MARLTDEELTHLEMFGADDVPSRMSRRIWSLIEEIRERRAADLSDEERQGLEFAKARVLFNMNASAVSEYFSDGYVDRHLHAVAVLDRLLSHAGGDK